MKKLENALIAATLINTIFQEYNPNELNSSGELVRSRIAKFIRQRSKSNKKLTLEVIMKVDKVWRVAINHFAKEKLAIEAKATITAIYNYFENELTKYAKVTDAHIEKFMINGTDNFEAEKNSDIIVDFMAKELGIEKKKSAFAGKFAILKGNLITDGKEIKKEFL